MFYVRVVNWVCIVGLAAAPVCPGFHDFLMKFRRGALGQVFVFQCCSTACIFGPVCDGPH